MGVALHVVDTSRDGPPALHRDRTAGRRAHRHRAAGDHRGTARQPRTAVVAHVPRHGECGVRLPRRDRRPRSRGRGLRGARAMPRRPAVRAPSAPDPSRHLGDRGPRGAARATRLAMCRAAGRPLPVHSDPGPLVGRLSRQPGRASPVQLEAPARQSGQDVRHALRARGDRWAARRGARGIPRAPRSAMGGPRGLDGVLLGRAAEVSRGVDARGARSRLAPVVSHAPRRPARRRHLRVPLSRHVRVLPDGLRPRLCPPRHRAGDDRTQHQERHRGRSRRVRSPARHRALQVRLGSLHARAGAHRGLSPSLRGRVHDRLVALDGRARRAARGALGGMSPWKP